MLKRTALKSKKKITLRKTPLQIKVSYKGLKHTQSELKKTELVKQNIKAKKHWEKIREQCLRRDNYKCIICKKPATQVHHIHLRSKRKDLIYVLNNLCSLCDKHHFHQGMEKYFEQTKLIADSKHISIEELLQFAERKEDGTI